MESDGYESQKLFHVWNSRSEILKHLLLTIIPVIAATPSLDAQICCLCTKTCTRSSITFAHIHYVKQLVLNGVLLSTSLHRCVDPGWLPHRKGWEAESCTVTHRKVL
ncbi:hypothetical protein OTU49_002856 [Cherax quadricarinatus]|uniref:Uncharacterized protein n=1 Tax=Cherax quadricarinatus TaxID=27406 RepID=A0AAW0XJZ4_CHEQU